MLDILLFISFVNITVNHSISLFPSGKVYDVSFNISLPPKTDFQNVVYLQNYSFANDNYFTHFFIKEMSTQQSFFALANVVRKFQTLSNLSLSTIGEDSYLSPSPEIESDDPMIIQIAKRITNNSVDNFERIAKIASFVYKNISYDLSSLYLNQSAKATLLRKSGVCEGKSRLFVALARAIGIPARYAGGISITNSSGKISLGLHSWAEVFLGKWVEVDPTWFEIATLDAGHVITEREGLNDYIYYSSYGATISVESKEINSTSKINKIDSSSLDYNISYSSLSIPGNGKALIIITSPRIYASDIFQLPECTNLIKTSNNTLAYFEPNRRYAFIEINATNQGPSSWICHTSIFGNNLFKEKNIDIEVKQPEYISDFYVKLQASSLLPLQNQSLFLIPTVTDNFTIATPCYLKNQKLFAGVAYSFSFPACSNFVYVANSKTFKKLTFSFQKPSFQISEMLPSRIVEGNNFTLLLKIKTNATNYKLFINYLNKTKVFELTKNANVTLSFKALQDFMNITIIGDGVNLTKFITLNLTKPFFNISTQIPNYVMLGKNFSFNLKILTNFQGNYNLTLLYLNKTKKELKGNSTLSFVFEAFSKPIIINISYLNYSITKTIEPNYLEQPKIFVNVVNRGNMSILTFNFKNYAKNITIKIGELRWFFNSENNSKEEIRIFGYGNFVCEVYFQDFLGNFYNASFPISNIQPKSENFIVLIILAFFIAFIIFLLLYKLMHHRYAAG
ncbi:MAG: transglutaminase-like domain-containing protein [Candidatus Micrarchaeia archaeon]